MATKLYVGNLSYNTAESQVKELLEKSGTVDSVSLITDKYTGASKGFAFVEMANDEEAMKAIEEANGTEIDGRTILVNKAKPPRKRNDGFGGGGGYNKNQGGGGRRY